jgi:DNA-binding NarL/FixJ family response regulator
MIDKKIKILLVEDHPLFLNALSQLISGISNVQVVGKKLNAQDALNFLEENRVDVVITDIDMPGMDGVELSGIISKQYPRINIMVVSMVNKNITTSKLLEYGISGYLLKNASKNEFITAINTITKGNSYYSTEIKEVLFEKRTTPVIKLTTREKEVLDLVAKELTMQEIAEVLFISPSTVVTHRKRLLQKFDVRNTAGLIHKAMKQQFLK